jgi:sugar/nucleoside kinase (ribokinase family)
MSLPGPASPSPLICAAGDLVDDIVVHVHGTPVRDADVPATVTRHRGGSAANTAAVVARLGGRARFVGQVGHDPAGALLVDDLTTLGVECAVRQAGVTGTVVVVVEPDGSRTMFSDRRAAGGDAPIDERVVDDVDVLHVPYFGLAGSAEGAPFPRLVARAGEAGVVLSFDPSSVALCGPAFLHLVRETRPGVVLCNEAEAAALGVDGEGLPGARLVVVKQGPAPALLRGEVTAEVPVPGRPVVVDTTGAGDAFAGGFLLALARGEGAVAAAHAGHTAAARVIAGPGADARCDPGPGDAAGARP